MPVYNAAPFLAECLDSVLCQTHKEFEVLAVNDFSEDSSLEILQKYAAQDERIKILTNEQKGILPALKKALNQSNGQFITRMDADDIMVKHKLASMINVLLHNTNAVAVGKVEYFATGKELANGYVRYSYWLNMLLDNDNHFDHLYKECVIPSPCWMMERTLLEAIGGFDNGKYPEDYDLAFRLYKHRANVVGVDDVLHLWRDHDSRASRNDKNYADQGFITLKLDYFLEIDRMESKELMLWGAGRTGKSIAKDLLKREVTFRWCTDNASKVNQDIYGVILEDIETIKAAKNLQIITAVKTPDFANENRSTFQLLRQAGSCLYHFY